MRALCNFGDMADFPQRLSPLLLRFHGDKGERNMKRTMMVVVLFIKAPVHNNYVRSPARIIIAALEDH